jgi:redox-sensing transcriptional repressor
LEEIFTGINNYLDTCKNNKVVLVGVGNLGRSVLSYCDQRHSKVAIIAAFDRSEELVGKVIQGCRCYHIDELRNFVKENNIKVGIATVRSENAENAVTELVNAGIKGILNFTPKQLNVPDNVYVENVDMMMSLEKVIYITGNY